MTHKNRNKFISFLKIAIFDFKKYQFFSSAGFFNFWSSKPCIRINLKVCSKQKASSTTNQLLSFKGLKIRIVYLYILYDAVGHLKLVLTCFKEGKAVVFEKLPWSIPEQ
jgi:hypothetical protein